MMPLRCPYILGSESINSSKDLFPFFILHELQDAIKLSGSPFPPFEYGTTWSATYPCSPQYWQVKLSLFKIHALKSLWIILFLESAFLCFAISLHGSHIPLYPWITPHGLGFVALPNLGVIISVYREIDYYGQQFWPMSKRHTHMTMWLGYPRRFVSSGSDTASPITIIRTITEPPTNFAPKISSRSSCVQMDNVIQCIYSDRTPYISIALYCKGDTRSSEKNYLSKDDGDSRRQRVCFTFIYQRKTKCKQSNTQNISTRPFAASLAKQSSEFVTWLKKKSKAWAGTNASTTMFL